MFCICILFWDRFNISAIGTVCVRISHVSVTEDQCPKVPTGKDLPVLLLVGYGFSVYLSSADKYFIGI